MPKRRVGGVLLSLCLDPRSTTPRYRQIYDALRDAILAGRVAPRTRLPSTRTLALEVGCSRNTVLSAFEQLTAEGYLEGKIGSGTRVARALPEPHPRAARPPGPPRSTRRLLSPRGASLVAAQARFAAPPGTRPFRLGATARDVWPTDVWARLLARWARRMPGQFFQYGDSAGYRPLREAIATYVREARAVRCDTEQVVVVSSAQQGIDFTARLLLDPKDEVWVEDPGYPNGHAAFAAAGARVRPIPVDAEGLDVAAGARHAPRAKLVYVTPSHQFPLGVTMSLARRLALLAWVQQHGAWVLEDDHSSEYRYTSRPLAALQGLDTTGRVIYLGTFNKVLIPSLRLAYLVVPSALVDAFVAARALTDRHSPTLPQAALADFITQGHFTHHIRRSRALYAERQAALVAAARPLAGDLDVPPSDAGMHLVGWLGPGRDDREVAIAARAHGVDTLPLASYRLGHGGRAGLILGYAAYTEREIRDGMRALERALDTTRVVRRV